MAQLKSGEVSSGDKVVHKLAVSTLFVSCRESINRLMFLSTAILESSKATAQSAAPSSADGEHIASLAICFMGSVLAVWKTEVGVVGWQGGDGDATRHPLPALTGPYLAQLIQSCLVLSQHRCVSVCLCIFFLRAHTVACSGLGVSRSKELSLGCLQVLSAMIKSLLEEPTSALERSVFLGAGATWRTFFPGIFGNLFVGCSGGYKR
jgi:hypothetical protein